MPAMKLQEAGVKNAVSRNWNRHNAIDSLGSGLGRAPSVVISSVTKMVQLSQSQFIIRLLHSCSTIMVVVASLNLLNFV